MELLSRVAEILEEAEVAYAVIGASAMAVYGVSRSTLDIDLITIDERVLRSSTWAKLKAEGIDVTLNFGDASDPLRGMVRFEADGNRPVDLIVGLGGWQTQIFERSVIARFGDRKLPVADKLDLVLLKLYAGGPQDLWDISQLLSSEQSKDMENKVSKALEQLPADFGSAWTKFLSG
jgi:hypothetical protein